MSFFNELKRRNVVRMGVLYVVASWVVLQIADVIFDPLGVPSWVFRLLMSLVALGFPFALIFSWIFELTPEGLKRERDIDRNQSIVHKTGHRMNTVIVVLLVLAIGGLIVDRLVPRVVTPGDAETVSASTTQAVEAAATVQDEKSIAVLPFVNMSGDPDNEYFSDGLSEELLNSLVRLGGLKVTGRTSSFAFKGQNQDLREIGRQLNVANVLEGSVRKAGNRVRITVQLVKASDGYHLWSDSFDRELDDIFAIQAEIADRVTQALHVTLMGGEADTQTSISAPQNAQAYEEYLRGMYIWQRNPDEIDALDKARAHFEQALLIDEQYADGYWGMFLIWDRMNRNGWGLFSDSIEQMQHYAAELNRLAPGSDRALSARGRNATVGYEFEKAAAYFEESVARYPGSATSQTLYASTLGILKRYDEAQEAITAAVRLDPLSLPVLRGKAFLLLRLGDCTGLQQILDRAMEINPTVGRFRSLLAMCIYEFEGDASRALPIAEAEPLGFAHDTALAILYHALGDPARALQQLDSMFASYGDAASYQYGQIYAQWGEIDMALTWLENAVKIRDPGIVQSGDDGLLDPLRDEPRFKKLIRDIGLVD
jgi:serine/threonine-protein kinase